MRESKNKNESSKLGITEVYKTRCLEKEQREYGVGWNGNRLCQVYVENKLSVA